MKIENYLKENAVKKIQTEIKNASGQEVYMTGDLDPELEKIKEINILARGNKKSAPAILSDLRPGNMVIHNHPSGDLRPSAADIRIASRIGNNGTGFAIINNAVDEIYVVVEPKIPDRVDLLDKDEIVSLFGPEDKLAEKMDNYEYREQQVMAAKKVIDSFNNKESYFIEAGTGTGKSFAYLIPALYWSYQNEQPVVVSTNTINLQEQIIKKDLVFLKKILPFSFKSVLVKGRRNYVCRRKINNLKKIADEIFAEKPEKERELRKILNWVEETDNGTRSDIDFVVKSDIWEKIVSETDLCLKTNCLYFNSCFFMEARKEVFSADILIVNHHLLLSDATLKEENNNGLLPDYEHLIIDEAHNFNDIATYHLGHPFNYYSFNKFLERVDDSDFSLMSRIRNDLSGREVSNKKDIYNIIDNKILPQVKRIKEQSQDYFRILENFYNKNNEKMVRLTHKKIATSDWNQIQEQGFKISGNLNNLGKFMHKLFKKINIISEDILEDIEEKIVELESLLNNCQSFIDAINFNLEGEDENFVFWLEKERHNQGKVSQKNAPLNISEILPDILWEKMDNTVLTSATLTVNNNFKFFKRALGLKNNKDLRVRSPFDYSRQAQLLIPEDIPPANSNSFLEEIMDDFEEMLTVFKGSTMVLFTSYSMLNHCLKKTETSLNNSGINILPQGKYPRHYIINQFKKNKKQIIFGTVSFWEGVDIKGNDLKYLIIMKLPFPVPSRPVAAAKKEQLQQEGKNPFYHYSLPRAVIRFKQGFGRLIRSREDKGIIINLDNRLLKKNYGKIFLNSLPEDCPLKKVKMSNLYRQEI